MHLKMPFGKWRPYFSRLNVLASCKCPNRKGQDHHVTSHRYLLYRLSLFNPDPRDKGLLESIFTRIGAKSLTAAEHVTCVIISCYKALL